MTLNESGGDVVSTSGPDFDVTAVIVNYNTRQLLLPCVEALRAGAAGLALQIVIVDNASRDGSVELMQRELTDCELLFNEQNVGFGRANNQALPLARGRHVLLLNTDAFIEPGGVVATVRFLDAHPRCALLGVRLVGREGDLQPSCRYFPTPWNGFIHNVGLQKVFPGTRMVDDMAWDHASPRSCDWVPGCYYLVRKSVVDEFGLFDPRFFMYFEEVDHCRRVRTAGWEVWYFPGTTVVHIGGESARVDHDITAGGRQISALQIESSLLYFRKHHGLRGVLTASILVALGNAVLALKWILKRRRLVGLKSLWSETVLVWTLLRRTAWASQPTR